MIAAPTPQLVTKAREPEFDLVLRGNYSVRFVLWRHRYEVELAVQPQQGCKNAGVIARIYVDGKRRRLATTLDKFRRLDVPPVCRMRPMEQWSMGRGVPHHRYNDHDIVTDMHSFAFEQLYTEPIEGWRRWGLEGRAMARAVMADVRNLLDEFGRLALSTCDQRALELVRRFRPDTRWAHYRTISADETGRLGQLAVSCPGALIFALAIERDAPRSPLPGDLRADAIAGKTVPRVLDAGIARWIEQPSFDGLMMDGVEATVWHSLARLSPRQRARLRSKKRVLLMRAREAVRLEDLLKPPPRRFAPEDIPTRLWPNSRWYRVMAEVPEFLGTEGRNTEALEGLCSCVSLRAGEMTGNIHEIVSEIREIAEYVQSAFRVPKRRSSLDRLAREATKWRAVIDQAREIEWREARGLPVENVEVEHFEARTLLARELAKGPDDGWSDDAGEIGELRPLWTVRDVFDEGFAMKHCLASQASKALSGGSVYYRGRTASGDRATIELRAAETGGWFVHQVRGPCNQSPTADVAKLVRTWAAARGMDVQDMVFGDLTELPDEPEEVPF